MPLRIHLLMHDLRDGPAAEHANIESHALALPDGVRQVHARLSRLGTGSGVDYLWKPFLPWLLPHVDRCIVVDLDVVFLTSPCLLLDAFFGSRPRREAIGWVQDVAGHRIYEQLPAQPNGGVIAMDLALLRDSTDYLPALEQFNLSVGALGDQSLYANLGARLPHLFVRLRCGLNRQLNTHVPVFRSRYACSTCDVLHFNGRLVKSMAEQLHRRAAEAPCAVLREHLALLSGSCGAARRSSSNWVRCTTARVVHHTIGDGACCGIVSPSQMACMQLKSSQHERCWNATTMNASAPVGTDLSVLVGG